MSTWMPCNECQKSDEDDDGYYDICRRCQSSRWDSLGPMFRDQAYRAHLAGQIVGLPCYPSCPEDPATQASLDLSFLQQDKYLQPYTSIIHFASTLFERPKDSRSVTALEVLVGEFEVDEIKYCQGCISKAERTLECNPMVRLCRECLRRRENHIKQTFGHLSEFVDPMNSLKPKHRARLEELVWGHADLGYDNLLQLTRDQCGGGLTTPELIAMCAVIIQGFNSIGNHVTNILNLKYAKKTLDETIRHNKHMERLAGAKKESDDRYTLILQRFENLLEDHKKLTQDYQNLSQENKKLSQRMDLLETAEADGWNEQLQR